MVESLKFYMDENIPQAVIKGLRRRGLDVVTAQESEMLGASDRAHLNLASRESRILVTRDVDFLRMHARGEHHPGMVFVTQNTPVGAVIRGLLVLNDVLTPKDMINHVEFL